MCDSQNHTKELIERAHKGDNKARDTLITENFGLVYSIVKRFLGRGYEAQDLFQIGSIGLIKAVDNFDTKFGVCFSTYAVPVISGEIKRFLRDDGIIKISRTIKENAVLVQNARQLLQNKNGAEPRIEEICTETGLSKEDIILALESLTQVESVNKVIYESDGSEVTIMDRLSNTANFMENKDIEKDNVVNHIVLEEVLNTLDKDEKKLIMLRYFRNKTQNEVAAQLGTTQVCVSRTEKKILKKLRQKME